MSARMSSVSITSASPAGSMGADLFPPSCTWMMSSFSKQRTTWRIASHSRMFARNLLPRPSPFEAPFTRPAMSVNSTVARMICCGCAIAASASRRGSCTSTMAEFGSIVQNG